MTSNRQRSEADRGGGWRHRAGCLGLDTNIFFPVAEGRSPDGTAQAKSVCQACPVREPCLQWALSQGVDHGVWGGFTAPERRALRFRAARRRVQPVNTRRMP